MTVLGPKCQRCQEFTHWTGALIGGTQVFACPVCCLLYCEVPSKIPLQKEKFSLKQCLSKLVS